MQRQSRVEDARRPEIVSELLTLREAMQRWPQLYTRRIYAWVAEGRLHPVMPAGRLLYPEWELRQLAAELRGRAMKPYAGSGAA